MNCHEINSTLLHPIRVKTMTNNIALLTWRRRSRVTYRQVIPFAVSHRMMKKWFMLQPEKPSAPLRRLTLTWRQVSTGRQKTKNEETLVRLSSTICILCILCKKKRKNQALMQPASGLPSKMIANDLELKKEVCQTTKANQRSCLLNRLDLKRDQWAGTNK